MRSLTGRIEPKGPFLFVTAMQTTQYVERAKAAGITPTAPMNVRALVDTGASSSALDATVIQSLNLIQTGRTQVHTPSGYGERDQFDVSLFFGSVPGDVKSFTVSIISSDLASEGFLAILGWDILRHCILTCDGPKGTFRLDY